METRNGIIADEFGPQYVVEVNVLKPRFKGLLVIDNLALGVGKGGIRLSPSVSVHELFRLARTMTWKNSLFGLPFGGAKAGIVADPTKLSLAEKKKIIQAFARALSPFVPKYYIAGPDMNTCERDMQWFSQALGLWQASTGKPSTFCRGKVCGLPHELGSTGFGVAVAAKVAAGLAGLKLKNSRVAIAGFGNVGTFAARHLEQAGAKIVAVADACGLVFSEKGLPLPELMRLKERKRPITALAGGEKLPLDKVYELAVDILIPAAVCDVINQKNYRKVKAKIIVEGANIPIPEDVENELWERGVLIVPDFVANAGGVISSFAEYSGQTARAMFKTVEEKIRQVTQAVLEESRQSHRNPRQVALVMARDRVKKAMK
jgi:glutamate dehydrogenase/leucine dehydrogenase